MSAFRMHFGVTRLHIQKVMKKLFDNVICDVCNHRTQNVEVLCMSDYIKCILKT